MKLTQRFRPLAARLALLFAVMGPGIITANVDNDAGGITTYSIAGAHFGYSTLWIMPFLAVALIIVQEMSARLGVVTGKGLADLIRESLGVKVTSLVVAVLLFANLANTVSEFAGVAASMEIFGVSKFISVPIAAFLVWILIVRGNYRSVEKIFLAASAVYLAYVIAGILERPAWGAIARSVAIPQIRFETGFLTILVTIIGTTIAPWMQFYQQSAIADKGLKASDYRYERLDVIVGSLFAIVVAAFITISCAATLNLEGVRIRTRKMLLSPCVPWPVRTRGPSSRSACSMHPFLRPQSCRFPLPILSAKPSDGNPGSAASFARLPLSSGSTRPSSS